jgi:hypothetical protein
MATDLPDSGEDEREPTPDETPRDADAPVGAYPPGREGSPGDEIAEEPVDGGPVYGVGHDLGVHPEKADKEFARKLAILLVWILAFSALLHYAVVAIVQAFMDEDTQPIVESLGKIFSVWLPVMSGFVGAAVTYYFTKR